jgi:hypothetical protein
VVSDGALKKKKIESLADHFGGSYYQFLEAYESSP